MTGLELEVLQKILSFGDEGSVIRGRNAGTHIIIDLWGEYGVSKYVVTDGDGDIIAQTDELSIAWGAWMGNET